MKNRKGHVGAAQDCSLLLREPKVGGAYRNPAFSHFTPPIFSTPFDCYTLPHAQIGGSFEAARFLSRFLWVRKVEKEKMSTSSDCIGMALI